MKLIIDIPEEDYKRIVDYYNSHEIVEATYSYIKNGTPLGNVVSEETYTDEYTRRKDAELELYKLQRNIDDITTEIKEIIKLYEGTCDQELGTKWGFEGALEVIDKHIGKEKE